MRNLAIRLFINALALWGAAAIVPGVRLSGEFLAVLLVALIFGLVNALIKPVMLLLTLPLLVITVGLFTLVINGLMLMLTGWLTRHLTVEGFWAALLGAVVVSAVSFLLSVVLDEEEG